MVKNDMSRELKKETRTPTTQPSTAMNFDEIIWGVTINSLWFIEIFLTCLAVFELIQMTLKTCNNIKQIPFS